MKAYMCANMKAMQESYIFVDLTWKTYFNENHYTSLQNEKISNENNAIRKKQKNNNNINILSVVMNSLIPSMWYA